MNNIEIVQEAYFGRKKEFTEIEKLLDVLIGRMKANTNIGRKDPEYGKQINDSPELKRIELLFCKAFDLSDFVLNFYTLNPFLLGGEFQGPNAFTIPDGMAYLKKDPTDPTGKLVNPKKIKVGINVDVNLVTGLDFDAKELMAIILHELGHCMRASSAEFVVNFIKLLTTNVPGMILNKLLQLYHANIGKFASSLIEKMPVLNKSINKLKETISSYMGVYSMIFAPLVLLSPTPILSMLNPFRYVTYSSEKFADSFASAYGYAKPLASAMNKLNLNKNNMVLGKCRSIPYQYTKIVNDIAVAQVSDHPPELNRIQSQLDKLRRDLASDTHMNPEVRKELKQNIKDLEDYIHSEVYEESLSEENRRIKRNAFNKWVIDKRGKITMMELIDWKSSEL